MSLDELRIDRVLGCQYVRIRAGEHQEIRQRASWGVTMTADGASVYRQGERQVTHNTAKLMILPKNGTYTIDCIKTGEWLVVNFDGSGLAEQICALPLAEPRRYAEILQKIIEAERPLRQLALLYALFASLSEEDSVQKAGPDLSPALEWMEQNLADPTLDSAKIAARMSISPVYLRRLFAAELGTSPIRRLREMRMARARRLLAEGRLGVAEIAAECGYGDIFSFSAAFKKAAGVSPTAYRRELL